jgi:hypothetical protein
MPYQQINCNVSNCKFNDKHACCTLGDITVGNTTPSPHDSSETECDSFQEAEAF